MPYQEDGISRLGQDIIRSHTTKESLRNSSSTGSSRILLERDCGHGIHGQGGGLQRKHVIRSIIWGE